MESEDSKVIQLTRVRFVYYDEDGNEYHVVERDMNMVPNVGEEIFLDTDDSSIDLDGWTVKSRVCDLGKNCWLLSIKHRLDDETGIWRLRKKHLMTNLRSRRKGCTNYPRKYVSNVTTFRNCAATLLRNNKVVGKSVIYL